MKIDVKGHEFEVLRGAHQTLSRGDVDIIAMEFGIHQVESRHFFKDFYTLFVGYGFEVHFARGGQLHTVARYEYQYEDLTNNFQVLATRLPDVTPSHFAGDSSRDMPAEFEAHTLWQLWQRDRNNLLQAQSRLQSKEAEIAALREALAQTQLMYQQSTSWRMTAPMRRIAGFVRR
jgi:hypothetical protein